MRRHARTLLLSAAALSTAAAASPSDAKLSAPMSAPTVSAKASAPTSFARLIDRSPQYIIVGDTNHSKTELLAFMARDTTLAALQKEGVKQIMLERPNDVQTTIDALAAGTISREGYVAEMTKQIDLTYDDKDGKYGATVHNLEADLILRAQKHGIKINAVDNADTLEGDVAPAALEVSEKIFTGAQDYLAKNPDTLTKLTPDQQTQWFRQFSQDYMKDRLTQADRAALTQGLMGARLGGDGEVADRIQQRAGTDKTVVFYGSEHGDDFARALGKDKTRKIALMAPGDAAAPSRHASRGWASYVVTPEAVRPAQRPSVPTLGL